MNTFIYWSHKTLNKEKLAEIKAETILEADKELEKQTGFNPVKCTWIGCEILFN